jgi:hypothetical protein
VILGLPAWSRIRGSAPLDRVRFVWAAGFDPTVAPGIPAPIGTIAMVKDGLASWTKIGPLATDWADTTALPRLLAPRVTLAAPALSLSVTGLPSTGRHVIRARLINANAAPQIDIAVSLLPNGVATNLETGMISNVGVAIAGVISPGSGYVGIARFGGVKPTATTFEADMHVATGFKRVGKFALSCESEPGGSSFVNTRGGIYFKDDATAIARWDLVSDGANFAAGSWMEVCSA